MVKMASRKEEAAGAARAGADLDRPIAGEDPATGSLEEAQRWVTVYHQLVDLEQTLFDAMAAKIPAMPPAARREAEETNVPVLLTQLERFKHRLEYWRGRRDALRRGSDETDEGSSRSA